MISGFSSNSVIQLSRYLYPFISIVPTIATLIICYY